MFTSIKDRLPSGYIFKKMQLHRKICRQFPNEVLEKQIYEIWKNRFFHIFKEDNASEILSRASDNNYIKCDGKWLVLPNKEAIDTFIWEYPDLIMPMRIKEFQYDKFEHLFDEGPYEITEKVSVHSGDIVIDCGANMGCFCSAVAERAQKIYAFEPSENLCDSYLFPLQKKYSNIVIENMAVSNETGKKEFCFLPDSCGASYMDEVNLFTGEERKDKNILVNCITLDDFVKERHIEKIDFIKADIEGSERMLLLGATEFLKQFSPAISICTYHLKDDKEILSNIILEANSNYHIELKYKKLYAYVEK